MCDFCSAKKPKDWDFMNRSQYKNDSKKEFRNESLAEEFDAIIEGNKLIFSYDAYSCDSSFCEEITIKFCPMCGRSL